MKVAVASGHRGFKIKAGVLSHLKELNHEVLDCGPSTDEICDYPDYAGKAAEAVSDGETERAILIGGTGIGMCILANKFKGVRAAVCQDELTAELSRRHYDVNVLCLSSELLAESVAVRMIEIWLTTPFEGGRHARRMAKISEREQCPPAESAP